MSRQPEKYKRGEIACRASGGLYLETEGSKLAGVCAGLAVWTGIPAILWRLGFVAATLTVGAGIPAYVAMWLLMDDRPEPEPEGPGPDGMTPEEREIWEAVKKDMDSLDLEND